MLATAAIVLNLLLAVFPVVVTKALRYRISANNNVHLFGKNDETILGRLFLIVSHEAFLHWSFACCLFFIFMFRRERGYENIADW
jgi:hypothetical protein